MPLRVGVLYKESSPRSYEIARAFAEGIRRSGEDVGLHDRAIVLPDVDVLVGYGWTPFREIFEAHRAKGRSYVFIDLGFWGRKAGLMPIARERGNPVSLGMHKVSVDGRHPTKGWPLNRPQERFFSTGQKIRDWHRGDYIVVPGMSAKAAASYGFEPQEWERTIVAELKRHTDRRIIYRSKPGDNKGKPLEGVEYCHPSADFTVLLKGAHAVVCRHSNAAVEALMAGVQVYAEDNVGAFMSTTIEKIDAYHWPDGREQFLADVAYCQWSLAEMLDGTAWGYLRTSGLLEV